MTGSTPIWVRDVAVAIAVALGERAAAGYRGGAAGEHMTIQMDQINILLRTSEYRGDHAADVGIAFRPIEVETVEQLIARLKPKEMTGDCIEIRLTTDIRK